MTDQSIITIENLSKTYKGFEEPALDNLCIRITDQEIFGLLGPNGAGKTTTIHILCGLIRPSTGQVTINGLTLDGHLAQIRPIIGVVPQEIALYPTLTAWENLQFIGNMYGLKGPALRRRIEECLDMLGLLAFAGRKMKTYSGGMKRRINLIAGILHKPRILFLDEPTVGIDVQSRMVILDYLKELNRTGSTIIYTSHYLGEAEELCSRISILDGGRMIAEGRPKELIAGQPDSTDLETLFLHLTGRHLRDH
ncbi:MAG: ABC transporter ATP-binding protein [Desulfobacca sp.]|nr:ABC transporter ATP-binding protein [Desulfobacca sp.]